MMKKLLFFLALLLPIGAWADEVLVASQDWVTPWFDNGETNATCALTADGIAITNPKVQTDMWTPQTEICVGNLTLKKDHYYIVRLTIKVPSNGTYFMHLGSWESNDGCDFTLNASDDFQVIDLKFDEYHYNVDDAHVLFQSGYVKGTTVIQNVQVLDVTNDETLLVEKNWISPFWFDDGGTDATCEMVANGVAITNPKVQSELYTPQTEVLQGAKLEENHTYKVMIEAKIPSKGELQVNMGNGDFQQQYSVPVTASKEFQNIEVMFNDFPETLDNVRVLFQNGGIKGTSIVRYVQINDLGDIPVPLKYKYNPDEETATVIKDPDRNYKGAVVIPSIVEHNDIIYTVTEISDDAFQDCVKLTSITIPATVTKFHGWAFLNCTSLQQIIVNPNNPEFDSRGDCNAIIQTADNKVVVGCETTVIPNGITRIGTNAFWGRWGMKSMTIPETVKEIGEGAFAFCISLRNANLPSSIEKIEGGAFAFCDLKSVTLPATLTDLEPEAFRNCENLESVVIPDNLEEIPDSCFKYCKKLESIDLKNVKKIGGGAFASTGLTSLVLPASVKEVCHEAFGWCPIATLDLGQVEKVGPAAFISNNMEELTIPATLIEADGESFSWNGVMKKAIFQDGCTKVFDTMFHYNENLSEVVLPNTITEIQNRAFRACKSLSTVAWPNKLERIGEQAFQESGITSAVLPASVKEVCDGAFTSCPITTLNLGKVEKVGHGAFMSTAIEELSIPATLTEVGLETFSWNGAMKKVVFEDGCTKVFDTMFHGNENLSEVVLPNTITEIQDRAFRACKSLSTVAWPDKLESIGEQAFQESGITSAVLPQTLKWIGNQAFQYCNQLAGYVDLASIEHLGYNAFSDCPLITMTSIPPTIVIDENSWAAFSPSGLETVEFFEGTTRIDNLTFAGCENLKNLPYGLPSTLESIGHNAFTECKSLESVTIPQNVNWIQEEAFKDCSKLTSVISRIPDPTNMTFEKDVFTGISKNAVLYVPKGTISAYTKKGWTKYFAKVVEEPANTLYPKELSTRAGKQPTLAIAMDNDSKITAMQFDLVLPEGITVATDEDGMIITLGSRAATSHTVAKRIQNDGSVRIVCSSNSSAVFSGNTGSVVFVKLNVDSKVADGDYDVTVRNIELSSDNGVAFHPEWASATITVGGIIMGDVDYNGSVTVNDAVWIVRRILNNTPEGFVEAAADLDGNGSISINDKVVLINRYILGKNKAATRAASADDNATLSLADFNMKPGETRTIEVMMSTTRTDIEALQCDIYLPEGLEFVAKEDGGEKFYAEKGGRATNSHSISSYIQEDGALRVVESNDEGTAFRQNDKPVFTVTVKAKDDVKVGKHTIRLANMELSYGQPINPAEVKTTVTISIDNLGDVNNDGKVNQSDISALAELIMNGIYNARADMNKDGQVNAVDLVLLTNEIK